MVAALAQTRRLGTHGSSHVLSCLQRAVSAHGVEYVLLRLVNRHPFVSRGGHDSVLDTHLVDRLRITVVLLWIHAQILHSLSHGGILTGLGRLHLRLLHHDEAVGRHHLLHQVLLALFHQIGLLGRLHVAVNRFGSDLRLVTRLRSVPRIDLVDVRSYSPALVVWILSSQVIEVVVLDGFSSTDSSLGVHIQHLCHKVNFSVVHNSSVSTGQSLWIGNLRELKTLVSAVSIEFLLQESRESP